MSTSDSDEDIGRNIDHSSDDEYRKPQKKRSKKPREAQEPRQTKKREPKEQPPQQVVQSTPPPLPPSGRLNKARREYIIQNFTLGKEDPEYQCQKLANGSYRVTKRKSYFNATANVESGSTDDVQMTWMNLQTQMNESLFKDIHKLRKRYDKLADKYETAQRPPDPPQQIIPQPVPQQPPPPPPKPQPTPQRAPPRSRRQNRNPFIYARNSSYNVRDF
jgi:hypothetical protein